jgi:hypothetical protein
MVKVLQNFRLGNKAYVRNFIPPLSVKATLILLFSCFITQLAVSQEEESMLFGENKVQNLKYLKSLSSLEKTDACEKTLFFHKYTIDLTSGTEAKVLADTWVKTEPSARANNCNTLIPGGSVVKVYKNGDNPDFLAVKYRNKWGFISEKSVTPTE